MNGKFSLKCNNVNMGLAGFVVLFFVFNLWKNTLQSKVHKSFLNRAELGKIAPGGQIPQALTPFPNQMTDLEATSKLRKQLALTCTMMGEIFPTSVKQMLRP